MEQITIRLEADTLEAIEAEADDAGQTRSDYIRDVIGSRHESAADVDALEDEIDDLEGEVERVENEREELLQEASRLRGRLDEKDETVAAKQAHIESLESTLYERKEIVERANERGVFGRIRAALGSGGEEDADDYE